MLEAHSSQELFSGRMSSFFGLSCNSESGRLWRVNAEFFSWVELGACPFNDHKISVSFEKHTQPDWHLSYCLEDFTSS